MNPISVYVHIPFCTIKCGYCDFNAYAGMGTLQDAYFASLLDEIDASRGIFDGREIATIAFGGGTPGESPPRLISQVIARLKEVAPVVADAEVSLEANPGTTSGDMLRELRLALDPALEAPVRLAPLIDPNVHSCGTVYPHGYVELIIETIQDPDDETAFSGTYKLIVYDVPTSEGAQGVTFDAEGKISCSVG